MAWLALLCSYRILHGLATCQGHRSSTDRADLNASEGIASMDAYFQPRDS